MEKQIYDLLTAVQNGEQSIGEVQEQLLLLFSVSKSANTENNIKVDDPNAPWNWKKDSSEL